MKLINITKHIFYILVICFSMQSNASEKGIFWLNYSGKDFVPIISKVFTTRKWRVISIENGSITGGIIHRGINAKLTIYLEGNNLLYKCDCFRKEEMDCSEDIDGNIQEFNFKTIWVKYVPINWIENLKVTTKAFMMNDIEDLPVKSSTKDKLKLLKEMMQEGIISEKNYNKKRKQLIYEI